MYHRFFLSEQAYTGGSYFFGKVACAIMEPAGPKSCKGVFFSASTAEFHPCRLHLSDVSAECSKALYLSVTGQNGMCRGAKKGALGFSPVRISSYGDENKGGLRGKPQRFCGAA